MYVYSKYRTNERVEIENWMWCERVRVRNGILDNLAKVQSKFYYNLPELLIRRLPTDAFVRWATWPALRISFYDFVRMSRYHFPLMRFKSRQIAKSPRKCASNERHAGLVTLRGNTLRGYFISSRSEHSQKECYDFRRLNRILWLIYWTQ